MSAIHDKIFIISYFKTKNSPVEYYRLGKIGDAESLITPTDEDFDNVQGSTDFLNEYSKKTEFYTIGEEIKVLVDGVWQAGKLISIERSYQSKSYNLCYSLNVLSEGDTFAVVEGEIQKFSASKEEDKKLNPILESWFLGS